MPGQEWEYNVLQMGSGRSTHLAERINQFTEDGFEPFLICGDQTVTVLLRRPRTEKPEAGAPQEE